MREPVAGATDGSGGPEPDLWDGPRAGAFVDVTEIAGGVRLVVSGEIDLGTIGELRQALDAALDWAAIVELDLSDVGFIDSSGLGVIVDAYGRKRDDQQLVVTHASRAATRLFEVTGLAEMLGLTRADRS